MRLHDPRMSFSAWGRSSTASVFDHDPVATRSISPVENGDRPDDVDREPEAKDRRAYQGDRCDATNVRDDPANPSHDRIIGSGDQSPDPAQHHDREKDEQDHRNHLGTSLDLHALESSPDRGEPRFRPSIWVLTYFAHPV